MMMMMIMMMIIIIIIIIINLSTLITRPNFVNDISSKYFQMNVFPGLQRLHFCTMTIEQQCTGTTEVNCNAYTKLHMAAGLPT